MNRVACWIKPFIVKAAFQLFTTQSSFSTFRHILLHILTALAELFHTFNCNARPFARPANHCITCNHAGTR